MAVGLVPRVSTCTEPHTKHRWISANKPVLVLLIVAAALRIWMMPALHELRDCDEIGYVTNGLMAWEGMSPGWGSVPAGPQTWISWLYAAAGSGWELLHAPKSGVPSAVRPLVAVDQALFKTYEDVAVLRRVLLLFSLVIGLTAVYGGYRLGSKLGGPGGGFLMGGLVALLPLFVEYCAISKSCSDAWMFALLAISCAAILQGPMRAWLPAVLLGLAIGSRIDMLVTAPLVLWMQWETHEGGPLWRPMLGTAGLAAATALLAAPYAFQGFLGMLRTIVLARVIGYWSTEPARLRTLIELAWDQGLGPLMLATVVALPVVLKASPRRWLLAGIAALGLGSMLSGHYTWLRYNGGPLLTLLVFAAVSLGAVLKRWPPMAALLAASALLALPAARAINTVASVRSAHVPEDSTDWVDEHVPVGTPVYVHPSFMCKAVLPTQSAADAIWRVVTDDEAWRAKVRDGLQRFSWPESSLPRALSENNLCMDRGTCRRWFILGGGRSTRPRFDVRLVAISPSIGLQREALAQALKQTGGVVIWQTTAGGLPPGLGEPFLKWVTSKGEGTFVFVTADVREKLR